MHVLSTPPAFVLSQDQTLRRMISTRTRQTPSPGNQTPSQESTLTITVTGPLRRRNPHDGGYVHINALAFSTLLSSQKTDAHHHGKPIPRRGNPANLLRVVPIVNLFMFNFADFWDFSHRQHTNIRDLAARASPRTKASWWLPGSCPALRRSVPSGLVEL